MLGAIRAIVRELGLSRVAVKRVLASGSSSPPRLERAEEAEAHRDDILFRPITARLSSELPLVGTHRRRRSCRPVDLHPESPLDILEEKDQELLGSGGTQLPPVDAVIEDQRFFIGELRGLGLKRRLDAVRIEPPYLAGILLLGPRKDLDAKLNIGDLIVGGPDGFDEHGFHQSCDAM
jgi:hypothetical protein